MNKLSSTQVTALFACILAIASGCSKLMMSDFNKGTEIAEIDTGSAQVFNTPIDLPDGEMEIVFVVLDHDCNKPLNASVTIKVQTPKRATEQVDLNLDELTWPKSGQGQDCIPIGYLRRDDSRSLRPLKMSLDRGNSHGTLSVIVSRPADVGRKVGIWAVYNDRLPVDRMLNY